MLGLCSLSLCSLSISLGQSLSWATESEVMKSFQAFILLGINPKFAAWLQVHAELQAEDRAPIMA